MHFESFKKILFSDTLLPDIFICDYMPALDPAHVKLYIYCTFLCKYNITATTEELSKKLSISEDTVKQGFVVMESTGLIKHSKTGFQILDLKEKEINRLYREKTTSTPEEATEKADLNVKRNHTIKSINNMFFQGVMPPSWYTEIDSLFDKYKFDEDVMVTLFQHCYDLDALHKKYIAKVAADWHNRNIRTYLDVENYLESYQKYRTVRSLIAKKLGLNRYLTEYEQKYVEKWVMVYEYTMDIIDIALKFTTSRTTFSFDYLDKIISTWAQNGLKTIDEIDSFNRQRAEKKRSSYQKKTSQAPQKENFEQRQYDDDFFDKLDKRM